MNTKKLSILKLLFIALTLNAITLVNAQVNIPEISSAPTIDGTLDAAWNDIPETSIINVNSTTTRTGDANYNPKVRIAWKGNKLFFYFNIVDDVLHFARSGTNSWEMDYIAIYFNFNPSNTAFGGNNSAQQYRFNIQNDGGIEKLDGRSSGSWGSDFGTNTLKTQVVTGGYVAEVEMDLSSANWNSANTLGGDTFTMDIQAFDSDGGGNNLFWSVNGTGNNYDNVTGYSSAVLQGATPVVVTKPSIDVYQLTAEPTIDGTEDGVWASIPSQPINQRDLSDNAGEPRTPDADFDANIKVAWKNNKLFLLYTVIDNTLLYDPALERYNQDNVAVKLDLATSYLTDVNYASTSTWNYQASINESTDPTGGNVGGRGGVSSEANGWGWPSAQNQFPTSSIVTKSFTGGYNVEIAFDLADATWGLPSPLADGISFGFDAGVDDVDVEGPRKQLYWSNLGKGNNSWDNLSGLGVATLKAANSPTAVSSEVENVDTPIAFAKNGVLYFQNVKNVTYVRIKSLTGQEVKSLNINSNLQTVENLKTGIYLVTFKGKETTTQKVVVQ